MTDENLDNPIDAAVGALYEELFRIGKHRHDPVPIDPKAIIRKHLAAAQQQGQAAPPSTPVGVETVDAAAWIEVLELPEGFRVAEHLPGIWEYQFDIEDEADEDSDRKVSGASWNHPALAAIAAWGHAYDTLAQQPAAVDGAMVFRLAVWMAKHDGHDDPHHLIWEGSPPEPWGEVWNRYEDDARAALTAALATQHQEPTT